ncbi:transposase [Pseudorhodoferax sp. Leaf265]|uniref:transposase n=1 Tax=Pseudorhodoferax sp. Leaf265 TaxID=1736315 RepID=UPI00138F4BA9|nr:transposase [Pseudorhodoferax sp. Leaf265]
MKSESQVGKASRRQHDLAFKRDLVQQCLEPGASVSAIALRSGVNANMLFKWRRDHLRHRAVRRQQQRQLSERVRRVIRRAGGRERSASSSQPKERRDTWPVGTERLVLRTRSRS